MDVLRHDLFFWQLIHHLVITEDMRVIEVSRHEDELWLEQEQSPPFVIRVVRTDLDWSNSLEHDLQKQLSEQLQRKGLEQLNLFAVCCLEDDNDVIA